MENRGVSLMLDLLVGDPHIRPEDLPDGEALLEAVVRMANEKTPDGQEVDRVIFLGDQHHTHAIMHIDVVAFWLKYLHAIKKPVVMLLGNHDRSSDRGSKTHALMAYKHFPHVKVVDQPWQWDGQLFLPYYFDPKEFVAAANAFPGTQTLICHGTLTGATYENGFYAKDGVDPALLPQQFVISGHIHTTQEFGKVWYPGSPRWLNVSDANVSKYLWLVERDAGGTVYSNRRQYATDEFCSRLVHLSDTPEEPLEFRPIRDHRYVVDLCGPQDWIEAKKGAYVGRARVRTFRTDTAAPKVKESDGIAVALKKYVRHFKAPHQTSPDVLQAMLHARYTA
jgi:hypothetical protein